MLRSLSGRLAATFAVLALAILLAVGGAVFVVLRGLHADAAESSLADLAESVLPQARAAALGGNLQTAVQDIRDLLARRGISVYLVTADGRLRGLDDPGAGGSAGFLHLPAGDPRGTTVHGTSHFPNGTVSAWAATVLRPDGAGPRAMVFATPDVSGREALRDVVGAVPAVLLVTLIVGGGLGWLLARSVSAPLGRLARATGGVAAAGLEPLPLQGPTEVRDLTERFNAMTGELAETRRREAELLANLRHDLRTPLTVITGFAAALADGTATGEDAGRAARAIAEEAARLERLVGELGAIERLRAGAVGLRPEPLDAATLLRETATRFGPRAQAAGIEIAAPADEGPGAPGLAFAGDRLAVERILANLVDNALGAFRGPGGHIRLEAHSAVSPGSRRRPAVAFSVTDDGPGFPPGVTERVFERFYRADPSRAGTGSGLGLAIVRELARAHGGDAVAEEIGPHGARVTVVLPVVPELEPPEGGPPGS